MTDDTIRLPRGREAARIARVILDVAKELDATDIGGAKAFYEPAEWRARGEIYGQGAALVVVHEEGDLWRLFSPTAAYEYGITGRADEAATERMAGALAAAGYWAEPMYDWATAIYRAEDA